MLLILRPSAFRARTADSRPGPGPLILTSRFLTPHSCAALPADSAATWAANGVDLREPLKPAPPEVAHDKALPCRSVMVMIVLLNDAWICAMPSEMFFLTFLRVRVTVLVGACAIRFFPMSSSLGRGLHPGPTSPPASRLVRRGLPPPPPRPPHRAFSGPFRGGRSGAGGRPRPGNPSLSPPPAG